jgi:beta-N-acetylhexosaminidase
MLMSTFEGTSMSPGLASLIDELHVGNVVLLDRNVVSPEQLQSLTAAIQERAKTANGQPMLIAADQEGGTVQRLKPGFTRIPDAVAVGQTGDLNYARSLGRTMGKELRGAGVNLDLAPVFDVNDNPLNPVIGPRAFGSTPEVVRDFGLAVMAGLQDEGVLATAKHFPGHGNTSTDSHFALPVVTKSRAQLEATELMPFRAAITAGIPVVMIDHVAYPALDPSGLPASVSQPIQTGLLRGEMGFKGVIITDDMAMVGVSSVMGPEEAAVQAVLAGADILLCACDYQGGASAPSHLQRLRNGLLDAVRTGRISEARIDESYNRIVEAKRRASGLPPAPSVPVPPAPPIESPTSKWTNKPPFASGLKTLCPATGQWLLAYWGEEPTLVSAAAKTCPDVDRVWMNRASKWLGFDAQRPQASDDPTLFRGEAASLHSR